MGQLCFVVPRRDRLPPEALRRLYFCGVEGIPWRSTCRWIDAEIDQQRGTFLLERSVDESGNLYCPWLVDGYGEVVLGTASLMERDRPYLLPVELARGVLNRFRNQAWEWQALGLQLSQTVQELARQATQHFVQSVTSGEDEQRAADEAESTIRLVLRGMDALADEYVRRALEVRHQQTPQLPTLLGVRLEGESLDPFESQLLAASNAASVSVSWRELEMVAGRLDWGVCDRQIEWCRNHGLRIIGGPLLQLRPGTVPDWLYLWEDDFPQVQAYLAQYMHAVVERYRGRVQVWNCAAGMNVRGSVGLSEEEKLRLVVSSIDEIRREDPQTPLIITFDQPWAEYLAFEDLDLSPLHFADSLVRADLGVAGIGLQINIGYWPGGTLPRHRLEVSQMLDRWSGLGLPLILFLSAPSATGRPEGSSPATRQALPQFLGGPTAEAQARWAGQLLPLLLSKPYVQGIIWNQLTDAALPEFSFSGLFDSEQNPKPALAVLSGLKQQHLM